MDTVEGFHARHEEQYRFDVAQIIIGEVLKEGKFKLSGGEVSNFYFDFSKVLLDGEFRQKTGLYLHRIIRSKKFTYSKPAGLKSGGGHLAGIIAGEAQSWVEIRKDPHPIKGRIEGKILPEDKLLLVEDVTTSGSLVELAEDLTQEGYQVTAAMALVDRSNGKVSEAMENLRIRYAPGFISDELLDMVGI